MNPATGQVAGFTDISRLPVQNRIAAKRITWTGPLLIVVGRSALMFVAQGIVAAILLMRGSTTPWISAAPYWTVYGTLIDIGCLVLLWRFTRAEGTTIRSLIGPIRWRNGRDIFVGLGFWLITFPLFVLGGMLSAWLVYGTTKPNVFPGLVMGRVLPVWAIVYSCSVWWMIWSFTEETSYQGYVVPRIQALSGRAWVAVVVVGFWWALQHSFIPFIADWRFVLWRFLAFLPGIIGFILLYLRTKRLAPLIVAHYIMDIIGVLMTLKF
jgi:uncharacterized protein